MCTHVGTLGIDGLISFEEIILHSVYVCLETIFYNIWYIITYFVYNEINDKCVPT